MNLTIVGLGKIGRPLYEVLRRYHVHVIGYDTDHGKSHTSVEECVRESDAAIFVVQTPSLPDGSFSNEFLKDALVTFRTEQLKQQKAEFLYVVTSTTVPGSCEKLKDTVGGNLVYNPLFVRLDHVYDDLVEPAFFLVGASEDKSVHQWTRIWSHQEDFMMVPVERMSLTEAELAKITLNCALTMRISLANQLHLVAKRMGCNSRRIMEAVGMDPRIGPAFLTPGWPYGGPCLPRDNRMFQYVAKRVGIDAALSRGTDEINNRIAHETDKP